MKKYYRIILNQASIDFQYRFNILFKILFQLFQFLMIYFMWKSIYIGSGKKEIGDYTINQMTIYLLITNLTVLIYNFNHIHRIGNLVRNGKLTTLLLRPLSLARENFAIYIGTKIISLSFLFVLIIFFKIDYKFMVIIYILLTIIMYFYLVLCISILGFWLLQTWPLNGLFNGIFYILAGVYFPLNLLPTHIFNIVKYNPFSLVSYVLTNLLNSKVEFNQFIYYIISCVIWTVIFKILCTILLKKGLKTYEGMGA